MTPGKASKASFLDLLLLNQLFYNRFRTIYSLLVLLGGISLSPHSTRHGINLQFRCKAKCEIWRQDQYFDQGSYYRE